MVTQPHVTAEVRTVYRSVRGCKLTRHAAYIAAAKALIAKGCEAEWHNRFQASGGNTGLCDKEGKYQCRFHKIAPLRPDDPDDPGGTMEHYRRVLPRLVRFLKFVDGRRA